MPVTILVAEDSATMRRVLEMTFAGEDAKVTIVASGEALLEKAEEIHPDVVLADLSMEGMDGYGVAQEIRSKPALAGTAVIAMASQKNPYNEAKGKAAGVQDFVVKPFDTQALIDKVKQAASAPRPVAAPEPAAARPAAAAGRTPQKTATLAYSAISPQAKAKIAAATGGTQHGSPPAAAPAPAASAARPAARQMMETKPLAEARPTPAVEAKPAPAAAPRAAAPADSGGEMAQRLGAMGLSREQVEGVLALTNEVVEKVVWEVVPDLAETIIREEIKRLTSS